MYAIFYIFFENIADIIHATGALIADTQGKLMINMAIILAIASFTSSVMTHKSVPLYVRYSAQE